MTYYGVTHESVSLVQSHILRIVDCAITEWVDNDHCAVGIRVIWRLHLKSFKAILIYIIMMTLKAHTVAIAQDSLLSS